MEIARRRAAPAASNRSICPTRRRRSRWPNGWPASRGAGISSRFPATRRRQDDLRPRLPARAARRSGARGAEPDLHPDAGLSGAGVSGRARRLLSSSRRRGTRAARLGRGDRGRRHAGRMAGSRRRSAAARSARNRVRLRSRSRRGLPPRRGARFRRARGPIRAGARDRGAAAARWLGRGAARLSAGRRLGARLRALDGKRRPNRDPDDLAAAPGRPDPALRQALRGDRQAFPRHQGLSRHGGRACARSATRALGSSPTASPTASRSSRISAPRRSPTSAAPTRRATPRRRRCSPICTAARRRASSPSTARLMRCRSTTPKRCWSRSNWRSTGTRRRWREPSRPRARARNSSGCGATFSRRSWRSRRPGRCATITRPICTGWKVATGCSVSA